jgi:hypothetical protein
VLGYLGAEVEWDEADRCRDHVGVGQADDLEGVASVVELSHKVYQKGIALGKAAMQAVEERLERHPALPKYDILINPAPTS